MPAKSSDIKSKKVALSKIYEEMEKAEIGRLKTKHGMKAQPPGTELDPNTPDDDDDDDVARLKNLKEKK